MISQIWFEETQTLKIRPKERFGMGRPKKDADMLCQEKWQNKTTAE
jgi:hypothetical protein